MIHNLNPRKSDDKFSHAFWTYTGAFLFAVIMIVLLHETGHYLAYRWRGYEASIRINPFMGTTTCQQDVQPQDFIYIILGGSVFDLSIAAMVAILLRFARSSTFILLKMYAAMAFLIEGMVLVAGLFFDETITDFSWLISLGYPPIFVGIIGVLLIVVGGFLNYGVWNMVGITPESPRMKILLLNSSFLVYGLVGFVMSLAIFPIELQFFRNFMAISTLLQWLYLSLRIVLNAVFMPRIQRRMRTKHPQMTVKFGRLSMFIGSTSWLISFMVLN